MKSSQRRAWTALGIGPPWIHRSQVYVPVDPGAVPPRPVEPRPVEPRAVDKGTVNKAEVETLAARPPAGRGWLVARIARSDAPAPEVDEAAQRLLAAMLQAVVAPGQAAPTVITVHGDGDSPVAQLDAALASIQPAVLLLFGAWSIRPLSDAGWSTCEVDEGRAGLQAGPMPASGGLPKDERFADPAAAIAGDFTGTAAMRFVRGRSYGLTREGRRIAVVATHGLEQLLATPDLKREAWADLCLARSIDAPGERVDASAA